MRKRVAALLVAAAALVAACGSSSTETASGGDADQAANALVGEFATLNGGSVDLAEFEGQDVVLWFWAPW